jgi:hypothetical protein
VVVLIVFYATGRPPKLAGLESSEEAVEERR